MEADEQVELGVEVVINSQNDSSPAHERPLQQDTEEQNYFQKFIEQGFHNLSTSIVNALKPLTTAMKPGPPADNVSVGDSTSKWPILETNPGKRSFPKLSGADELISQKLLGSVSVKATMQM